MRKKDHLFPKLKLGLSNVLIKIKFEAQKNGPSFSHVDIDLKKCNLFFINIY